MVQPAATAVDTGQLGGKAFPESLANVKPYLTDVYNAKELPVALANQILDLYHECFKEAPFNWKWEKGSLETREPGTAAAFLGAYITDNSKFTVSHVSPAGAKELAAFGIVMVLDSQYGPEKAGVAEFGGKLGDKYLAVICVQPQYRGMGLFKEQIDERLKLCEPTETVWLRTHVDKVQVQDVYKRMKFELAGSFTREIFGGTTKFVAYKREPLITN